MTASEYFNWMKGFADAMASAGKPLSNEEILGYILAGLVRNTIPSSPPSPPATTW
jgi:hypothetical protein